MLPNVNNQYIFIFLSSVWILLPILFYFHIYILIVFYKQLFFFWPRWFKEKKSPKEEPPKEELSDEELREIKEEMEEYWEENMEELLDYYYRGNNFPDAGDDDKKKTWWDRNKVRILEGTVFGLLIALTVFLFTFKPKPGDGPIDPGLSLEIFDNTDIQESPFESYEQEQEYYKFRNEFYAFSEQIANFYSLVDSNQISASDIPEAVRKSEQTIRDIHIELGSGGNEFLRYETYRNFLLNPTTKEASLNMSQIFDFLSSEHVKTPNTANPSDVD